MKPIHQITNMGDILEDMDIHYWTRPLYNLCRNLSLYVYNLIEHYISVT